jgi:hypothetical protein
MADYELAIKVWFLITNISLNNFSMTSTVKAITEGTTDCLRRFRKAEMSFRTIKHLFPQICHIGKVGPF